jgi:hypothetical protein
VKKNFQALLAEYGAVFVVVYFAIFFAVLGAFWVGISTGWRPASAVGNVGAFTAAYLATKVTQPIRIAASVALTPLVARLYEKVTGKRKELEV